MNTSVPAVALLRSLPVGTRVTVRWALPDGNTSGKKFTDSIGTIVGPVSSPSLLSDNDGGHDPGQGDPLVLDTRQGEVRIPWEAVRLAKRVPPPPPRRPRD
ncbi:hypothetical protein GWK18_07905 [Kocuria sp. JC486]|uniref:putative acetyltransferase n=1 Tax=Kocuria sp. JC486 TaxID=1970736 RepID=UPI001423C023|nr:hypothetical protein [Kocuria sp. JC486]